MTDSGVRADPPGNAAEPDRCDHYWASHHQPGHRLYWVRQCMLCHAVDWDDLDREVNDIAAQAARDERQAIIGRLASIPAVEIDGVFRIRLGDLHELLGRQ